MFITQSLKLQLAEFFRCKWKKNIELFPISFFMFSIQDYQCYKLGCSFILKMITKLKASSKVHLETIFFIVRSNQKTKETKHGKI